MNAPVHQIDIRIPALQRELRRATFWWVVACLAAGGLSWMFGNAVEYVMSQCGINPIWMLHGIIPMVISMYILISPVSRMHYRRRKHLLDTMAQVKRTVTVPPAASGWPPEVE